MTAAYPEYRDSGIEWIGAIPSTWSITPMFAAVNMVKSKNTTLAETNLLSLSFGRIVRKDIDKNEGLLPESFDGYQIIERGDIVFRFTDLQNDKRSLRSALVGERGIITSAYLAITPRAHYPAYLAYLSRSYDTQKVFYAMGGGLRQSMKFDDVRRLPLLNPPLDEQRQIAEYLDRETGKIDELITKQEQLVATLTERRQVVIAEAVTRGLDSKARMIDSGVEWIGEMPAHWSLKQLKRLSQVKRGASPRPIDDPKFFDEDGEWAWVRIADASSSNGHLKETSQTLSALGSSLSVRLAPGSLFVSIAGTVGKPCITLIRACIHDGFVYFPELNFSKDLLFRIFEAGRCYAGLGKLGTQLNLNTDTIGSIQIPVPPAIEQDAIVEYLHDQTLRIDTLVYKSQLVAETLRERRAALISAAVTGKIDVRGL